MLVVLCRPYGDQRGLLVRVKRVPEVAVLQLHRRNMRSYLALAGQCFGTGDRPSPEDATQVLQGVEATALLRFCTSYG